ncbi:MAG: CpaF family protein, partial [bacterium]
MLKLRVHDALMQVLDLKKVEELDPHALRRELAGLIKDIVRSEGVSLDADALETLVGSVQDEIVGLGPIEPLMADPHVTDILVNGPNVVYVEKEGHLHRTSV